ncbi:MAG: hypothetical protein IPM82_27540 [Saprospiraceae bacterium]|nr:hypothetical protein [Saprospiraceae bacterium]
MEEVARFVAILFGAVLSILFIGGFLWTLFDALFTPYEKEKKESKPKEKYNPTIGMQILNRHEKMQL